MTIPLDGTAVRWTAVWFRLAHSLRRSCKASTIPAEKLQMGLFLGAFSLPSFVTIQALIFQRDAVLEFPGETGSKLGIPLRFNQTHSLTPAVEEEFIHELYEQLLHTMG